MPTTEAVAHVRGGICKNGVPIRYNAQSILMTASSSNTSSSWNRSILHNERSRHDSPFQAGHGRLPSPEVKPSTTKNQQARYLSSHCYSKSRHDESNSHISPSRHDSEYAKGESRGKNDILLLKHDPLLEAAIVVLCLVHQAQTIDLLEICFRIDCETWDTYSYRRDPSDSNDQIRPDSSQWE